MSQQKELTMIITSNIEKAFIFYGGQEAKDLYDLRIVKATEERIINVLKGIAIKTENGEVAIMELYSAVVALIKGENK